MVSFVSLIVLLFLIGSDIRRQRLFSRWSFVPSFLAWALLLAIPLGAILEVIRERLLEVSLLVVAAGWAMRSPGHSPQRSRKAFPTLAITPCCLVLQGMEFLAMVAGTHCDWSRGTALCATREETNSP